MTKDFTIHSMFLEIQIKFDQLKKRPTRHIAQLSYNLILRMNIEKQSLEYGNIGCVSYSIKM